MVIDNEIAIVSECARFMIFSCLFGQKFFINILSREKTPEK